MPTEITTVALVAQLGTAWWQEAQDLSTRCHLPAARPDRHPDGRVHPIDSCSRDAGSCPRHCAHFPEPPYISEIAP